MKKVEDGTTRAKAFKTILGSIIVTPLQPPFDSPHKGIDDLFALNEALRKFLEAKDTAVRATVIGPMEHR